MKLYAALSKTHAVFSVGRHDCRSFDGVMVDGGQPGLQDYAGYLRGNTGFQYIEIPTLSFDQLFNDYQFSYNRRQFGIHPLSEVKILSKDEEPDLESIEWLADNFIWGTRGKFNDDPLKYILLKNATTDHLKSIAVYQHTTETVRELAAYFLNMRS